MSDLRRFPDARLAAEACGRQILEWLGKAIMQRGSASLAISGGSSPVPMFQMLANTRFDWQRVHLFWVDERGVPPDDAESNFKLASETWLKPGDFPSSNVHRIEAELPAAEAAQRYVADIREHFGLGASELPRFDVMHRGMGPDAHTASLFPGEPMIANRTGIAAALRVEKFAQWRITLLPGVLLAARHTAMLVTGSDKSVSLNAVLHDPYDPARYPAQLASGEGTVWFLDAAAAEKSEEYEAGADRNQS
jgi:6-phosphogluconolactonase